MTEGNRYIDFLIPGLLCLALVLSLLRNLATEDNSQSVQKLHISHESIDLETGIRNRG